MQDPSDRPPSAYPPLPWRDGASPAPTADARPLRLAVVAVVAALVGALLGSGVAVLAVDRGSPSEQPAAASPSTSVPAPVVEVEGDGLDRVAAVAAAVLPTVVQINIDASGPLGVGTGNGSGVVYRSDGHIITNNHVVAGVNDIEVVLADGSRLSGEVIGTDPENDLAVVKVDRDGLPAIQIGDSSRLRVGELAIAVGSPFGLEGSVTAGVVSALNRPIDVSTPEGRPIRLANVIQTDAAINPGNSGGALVGGDGRLIGINSAILVRHGAPANAGVGFAIPSRTAVSVADELIERGFVQHPFLGVEGSDLTAEVGDRLGVDAGAYIEAVVPGTPAAEAGLRGEDVIVAVNGEPIESMGDLVVAIREHEVGQEITITYIRGGEEHEVAVTLAERPRES
jgi:S1-C subfamily serine protease